MSATINNSPQTAFDNIVREYISPPTGGGLFYFTFPLFGTPTPKFQEPDVYLCVATLEYGPDSSTNILDCFSFTFAYSGENPGTGVPRIKILGMNSKARPEETDVQYLSTYSFQNSFNQSITLENIFRVMNGPLTDGFSPFGESMYRVSLIKIG